MVTRYPGWTAFVLLAFACSTPPSFVGPGSDAGTDSGPSAMAACAALSTAECAKLEGCSSVLMETRYGSVAICQTRLDESCTTALAAPSTGNSAEQAAACAEAYPTWSCLDYLGNVNLPAACAQKPGSLPNGSACAFAAQCTTGFCALPPNAACGMCAPQPATGDSCLDLSTCGQRLLCFAASKVCGTLGASGGSCSSDAPCGPHLSCIGANDTKGVLGKCEASAGLAGAACDPTLVTGPGCDYDGDLTCNAKSKVCEPLTISPGGGPCGAVSDQFAACTASGTCSTSVVGATGICRAAAADGQGCTTAAGGPGCVPPARCIVTSSSSTNGTCQLDDSTACK
jgi:hypothetical protein